MDLRDLKLFTFGRESTLWSYRPRNARFAFHPVAPDTAAGGGFRAKPVLRDNRTVTLTEAGEQLRQFAQQTLLQYQQLRHAIDQHGPSLSGELKLFCSVTAAYSHLPPILDRFAPSIRRWKSSSLPAMPPTRLTKCKPAKRSWRLPVVLRCCPPASALPR